MACPKVEGKKAILRSYRTPEEQPTAQRGECPAPGLQAAVEFAGICTLVSWLWVWERGGGRAGKPTQGAHNQPCSLPPSQNPRQELRPITIVWGWAFAFKKLPPRKYSVYCVSESCINLSFPDRKGTGQETCMCKALFV